MCGIVGWVDFERDLTTASRIVEKMVATMALRGPDEEGMWLRPRVALGHRRLAVIDIEGGKQPMVTPAFDGREKSLLRGATRDLLPTSIVGRRKAPYPATQDSGYDREIKRILGKLITEPNSSALPLFDLNAISAYLDAPVEKASSMQERGLYNETPVRLAEWLTRYDVSIAW